MSYSTYVNDVIPMDFGLDLSSPKPVAQSGTLNRCSNYEITDRIGLRRIDGFERFDGRLNGGCTTFWEVGHSSSGGIVVGDYLAADTGTGSFTMLGLVVEVISSGVFRMAVINDQLLPVIRDSTGLVTELAATAPTIGTVNRTTKALTLRGAPTFVRDLRYAVSAPKALLDTTLGYQAYLRTQVTRLPAVPVLAHSYQGRHYAACGTNRLVATSTSTSTATITTVVGATVGNSSNSATARVLRIEASAGRITVLYERISGDISTAPTGTARLTGITGTLDGVAITDTTFTISSFSNSEDFASLYFCAGEQVEYDKLPAIAAGWRTIDMGYTLPFDNGKSATNSLAKYERGLGIPTGSFQYWISNGTTTFTCDLNSYHVSSGRLSTNNAVGFMQINKLTRTAGTDAAPTSGYTVYNSSTFNTSTTVANVTGQMVANLLPGLNRLRALGSRYQLRDRNFYAVEGLGVVYGVSGAGRAFYFDSNRLVFIYTQTTELTFPRHISFISASLALGYADGRVAVSVPGEPWNYAGLDGAYEYGAGHHVRGLLQMQGDTIGVFTSGGVFAIQGTNQSNFSTRVLVPEVGAVEYTVVSIGDAVFVSPAGVVTLSQTDKYGDFVGQPVSFKVNPLIRPQANRPGRIVGAIPVRNKNQYRLYCTDGTVFTLTFREGKPVETTAQVYYVNRSSTADFRGRQVVPLALSSVLDEDGTESMLFSHYSPNSSTSSTFLYRLDHGWGFDGTSIPADAALNWYFAQQPFMSKVLRKVRLDGVGFGTASLGLSTSKNYEPTFSKVVVANLPEVQTALAGTEQPHTRMVHVEERGLNVGLRIEHAPEFSSPEPSHTLQTLFIQFTGAKTDA